MDISFTFCSSGVAVHPLKASLKASSISSSGSLLSSSDVAPAIPEAEGSIVVSSASSSMRSFSAVRRSPYVLRSTLSSRSFRVSPAFGTRRQGISRRRYQKSFSHATFSNVMMAAVREYTLTNCLHFILKSALPFSSHSISLSYLSTALSIIGDNASCCAPWKNKLVNSSTSSSWNTSIDSRVVRSVCSMFTSVAALSSMPVKNGSKASFIDSVEL